MNNHIARAVFVISGILMFSGIQAQKTEIFTEPDRLYKSASELFLKEKYSAAMEQFDRYIARGNGSPAFLIDAQYYAAVSAFELFNPDAEKRLVDFTVRYPESTRAPLAFFNLGRYYYRNKQYRDALPAFEKTDVYFLSGDQIPEYYFKLGYCYFSKNEKEKASSNFHQILDMPSKYQTAAQYYYGHIAYSNNNYKTALEYFRKLDSSATFGPLVPYYITQMYYDQGKYDELISYAKPVLQSGTSPNQADITRLVAESYYRKGDFKNATQFFNNYASLTPQLSRDDHYSMGYCAYRAGNYPEARQHFEAVVSSEDSLAQNAYYHLADCFLKAGDKQSARNAFQSAGKLPYNTPIREASQFNYAKLSYELNFQPVAINAFRTFLKDYPNSTFTDDANELLARLYLTTRNYKDALAALENIKAKNARAKEAYQKVAFYRGVEFYADGDRDKAIGMFEKAIVNDVNPDLRAEAMYWKAEALYAQGKYDAAVKQYRIYIFNPGSVNTSMYNLANYNMGYCYFKMNNYPEAQSWFRKYLAKTEGSRKDQLEDALIRTADCFYATRDFDNALDYYNQAINKKAASADYCLVQKGLIQGIRGDMASKSSSMETLLASYPKSKYRADALFEKGRSQMTLGNDKAALDLFGSLMKDYPNSPYNRKALLNTGLIYYNSEQDEQALTNFKKVISQYPGTPEANEALASVKNIYVGNGKADDYFAYVKNIPNASISTGAQDSITYEAAEQQYLKGNFDQASTGFDRYLQQFPEGAFKLNATFYKAECDNRSGNNTAALTGYESIISEPRNIFTEKSLLKAASINYSTKNYDKAAEQYARLEQSADLRDNLLSSQLGLMRSYYKTGKSEQAITYAQKLLAAEKVPNEVLAEAHVIYGRSAMQTNDLTSAKREFNSVLKSQGAIAAEARYNLALIEYKLGNYKTAQTKCFDVINQVPSYDYWIAKSFLLLSDNYLALADTFQAKHTLQSLIDNYEKNPDDPEDIRAEADDKLLLLMNTEQEKIRKPEDQPENETDLSKESHQ